MLFHLYPLRFSFLAREPIHFPEGKSSNILRGAFGVIFRRIACVPQCAGAQQCEWRASCPYARMFEPSAASLQTRGEQPNPILDRRPSGLADWPRPFVFRAMHLDGRTIKADETFHFDLNLFDVHSPAVAYLVLAFGQLAREGLGPGRSRVELTRVSQLRETGEPAATIVDSATQMLQQGSEPLRLSLDPPADAVSRICVRFRTPTELKSGQRVAERPEFSILAARIRDRISTLRELYSGGPLAIDFQGFGERAALVRMIRCQIEQVEVVRRSTRTGQGHPIGGFIGEAEYEGDLTEFVPFLRAARWTGVGRQTVWGKGEISC